MQPSEAPSEGFESQIKMAMVFIRDQTPTLAC